MAITKRAKPVNADRFIAGAPDAKPTRWQRGNKTQITFTIAPALVDKLDAAAERRHVSRSALMTMWLVERRGRIAAAPGADEWRRAGQRIGITSGWYARDR
jgi:hypothetical protein